MPRTAFQHFGQDAARARAIVAHADSLVIVGASAELLRGDLLRGAWMFAAGAFDAYFCDAYTDVVAATIIAKDRHPVAVLPEFFYEIKIPIRSILEPYPSRPNWRWRMAARKMMERENVLSLERIQTLFNKFFASRTNSSATCWRLGSRIPSRKSVYSASRRSTTARWRPRAKMPRGRRRGRKCAPASARSSKGGTTAFTTATGRR